MPKQSAIDHSVQRRALPAEVCAGAGRVKTDRQIGSRANRLVGFSVYVVEALRGRDWNQPIESCTTARDLQHVQPAHDPLPVPVGCMNARTDR